MGQAGVTHIGGDARNEDAERRVPVLGPYGR
jgi:hypothetical protein